MTQTFSQDVVVNNTTSNVGLKINQSGSNEGVQINQTTNNYGIKIVKTHTGTSNPLYVNNAGTGHGLYAYQSGEGNGFVVNKTSTGASSAFSLINAGTGHGGYIRQDGSGNAMVVNKMSTGGAGGGLIILNAGTGHGLSVQQYGAGIAVNVNKTTSTDTTDGIRVQHAGTGNDIRGTNDNWRVTNSGDADFTTVTANSINVCPGMVYAQNTAIAGGRVHVFDRGQGPVVMTHCAWGIGPVAWQYASYLQGVYVFSMMLIPPVHCPIIKVTPWLAGQYDPTQSGNFNYIQEGHTNAPLLPPTAIEPHIAQTIPDLTGCVMQVDLYFQCCVTGNPAIQYPYEVWYNPEGTSHDLVFDFEILGCPCEAPR